MQIGDTFETKRLDTPLDKMTRERAGKRSYTRTERKRGRYIKARPAGSRPEDIAFDATLRAAAPRASCLRENRAMISPLSCAAFRSGPSLSGNPRRARLG